ncbi:hypothetical protein C8N46_102148 [Kordia periserrulae]|uniref:Uncharacterized protein n=1 Tax=Kordia periserrulae TaxID=701523 RepID=A0A2T6C368_9FLAO|nr:hypothetical protein [Kordia periserrulae]PTX62748.1 hypothetical protein C8N46_102148 [Kordia periserrulae]
MCNRREHPIPGKILSDESFDYNLVVGIPDPNKYIKAKIFLKKLIEEKKKKELEDCSQSLIDILIKKINLKDDALNEVVDRLRNLSSKDAYILLEKLLFFTEKPTTEVLESVLKKIRNTGNSEAHSFLRNHINLVKDSSKEQKNKPCESPKACEFLKFILHSEKEEVVKRLNNQFIARNINKVEGQFSEIYNDYMKSCDAENLVVQPTVGALRATRNNKTNIFTNIFFYENFLDNKFQKSSFNIYQNFEMGPNDRLQLTYYVCFKRTGFERQRGDTYRMHKFSIKNEDVEYTPFRQNNDNMRDKVVLDINEIDEVMAFVINVNPEASRGTSTTVKDASGN